MFSLSLPNPRLVAYPVRFVIIFMVIIGVLHTLSRTGITLVPSRYDASLATGVFPAWPSEIARPRLRPTLVSRPRSLDGPFTSHPHKHPYTGTAHHLTSSVHPSKDNQTGYLMSSVWFFEQAGNLDWIKIGRQGQLPTSAKYLDFTCEYQRGGHGEKSKLQAFTILQERKEYVRVECPLPPWVKIDATMSEKKIHQALDSFSKDRTRIIAWMQMGRVEKNENPIPWQAWRNKPHESDAIIRQQSGSTYVFVASQELSTGNWKSGGLPNKLAICVSPLRLHQPKEPDNAKLVTQLKGMVEWRIWHGFGGVEVVHWLARDANFRRWVDALNQLLGLRDTFLPAPYPITVPGGHPVEEYGDQIMYLADCLMRYGVTDEWQAMIDLDEYLLARDDPRPHWITRRIEFVPESIGSFSIDQTYHGSDRINCSDASAFPCLDEFPAFPRNGYKDWGTTEKVSGYRAQKAIHRTAAVHSIWVHNAIKLGNGHKSTDDRPGIPPDKGDYPSQLELLHDRAELPQGLIIGKTSSEGAFGAWTTTWQGMAEVLQRPNLAELWDPSLIASDGRET